VSARQAAEQARPNKGMEPMRYSARISFNDWLGFIQ
jgi:hypothetical protein